MISIIICSRKQAIPEDLSKNIEKTIGYEYELIVIDNSENKYSIFEAYNKGIKNSKGKYLCFIHDDILFHTLEWGKVLIRIFEDDNKIGLIGIAGAKIKTRTPSAWWDCPQKYRVINVIQHTNNNKIEKQVVGFKQNSVQEEVVAIDGVFMFMRKVKGITFNNKIKGFHNYDLNLSFEHKIKGNKVVVTNQVLIEHFSQGNINKSWYASTLHLHKLYKHILPLKTNDIKEAINETWNESYFEKNAILNGEKKVAYKVWCQLFLKNPFSKNHLFYFKNFIK